MDNINISKFISTLESKKYDYLYFDKKVSLWGLSRQPQITPPIFQFTRLESLIEQFDAAKGEHFYSDWVFGNYFIRNINNIKNNYFNIFKFNYLINAWVAENSDGGNNISAPTFRDLIIKLI